MSIIIDINIEFAIYYQFLYQSIKSLLKVAMENFSCTYAVDDIVFVYSEREQSYWPAKIVDISPLVSKVKLFVLNQYEMVKPKELITFQSKQLDKLKFQSSKRFLTALKSATKQYQKLQKSPNLPQKQIKIKFKGRQEIVQSSVEVSGLDPGSVSVSGSGSGSSKLQQSFSTDKSQKSNQEDEIKFESNTQLQYLYNKDLQCIIKLAQSNSKFDVFLTDESQSSKKKKCYKSKQLLIKLLNYYLQDLAQTNDSKIIQKLLLKVSKILNYFITSKSQLLQRSQILKKTEKTLKVLNKNKINKGLASIKHIQQLLSSYKTQQDSSLLHERALEQKLKEQLKKISLFN